MLYNHVFVSHVLCKASSRDSGNDTIDYQA